MSGYLCPGQRVKTGGAAPVGSRSAIRVILPGFGPSTAHRTANLAGRHGWPRPDGRQLMTRFAVEYATLDGIRQLAERQLDHLRAITAYLDMHTRLDGQGSMAVVMNALLPKYHEARDTALEGLGQGGEVCAAVAERASTTRDLYVAADRACVDGERAAAAGTLDVSGIAYTDPVPSGPGGAGTTSTPGDPMDRIHQRYELPTWEDPLGGARPAVTTVQTFSDKASGRIRPTLPDPTARYAIRAPFDAGMKGLVSRFWTSADNRYGIPGASSLRDQYQAHQMARFGAAYDAGYTRFRNPEIHPGAGTWVREGMTQRTVQSGALVMSTVTAVRGAWNNVAALDVAADRHGDVADVADGPENTATIDWARQP